MNAPLDSQVAKGSIGTSIFGVFVGTALMLYAQSMDSNSNVGKWILLTSPTIAVVLDKISAFFVFLIRGWLRARANTQTQENIKKYLLNKETSDTHKDNLRLKLEKLELDSINENLLNSNTIYSGESNVQN